MSRAYSIACKKCKIALWVGQGWPKEKRFIYKDEEHLRGLERFLFNHEKHDLVFDDDEVLGYADDEMVFFDGPEYLKKKNQ